MRVPARRQSSSLSHLNSDLHRLRHAPAVGEAELGEHRARRGDAEVLDQILSEQAHRDRVEQERALPREADQTALGVQLQQLLMIQIVGAHLVVPAPSK